MRKPPLTKKALEGLLACMSMARAEADAIESVTPADEEMRQEIYRGCDYIAALRDWHQWKQEQKGNRK